MAPRRTFPLAVLLGVCALASVSLAAPPATNKAPPPKKEQCFDAFEAAQVAQKDGRFTEALANFRTCSNAACPKLVTADCSAGLAKIKADMPSVRVDAREAGGGSLSNARFILDGGQESNLPAAALELDPGEHKFRIVAADGRAVEKRLTLKPGDHDVPLVLELRSEASPAPKSAPVRDAAPSSPKRRPSVAVWALGGVAVVGLVGFVGFGLSGKGKQSDLDACKPDCQKKDVDSMRQSYLFADLSLGVALVAGGVGAYLYLSSPKSSERAVWLRAVPEAHGASARVGASF